MKSVITTLMDNAGTICEESNQAAEHAKYILRKNGYSIQSINRATKAICTNKSNKRDHTAYLQSTHGSADRIFRLLMK
jgi:Zn-finger domain-containing protein